MTNWWRRGLATTAALVCGLMLAMGGTAAATDGHGGGKDKDKDKCSFGRAFGDAVGGPVSGVDVFAPKFDLCRTGPADTDVTGYFSAVLVPSGGLVAPQGPITCAAFQGNTVSFLYPLNEKSNPPFLAGQAILIVAKDGGTSGDEIGFFGPAPMAAFGGNKCAFSDLPTVVGQNILKLPVIKGGVTVEAPKA